MILRMDVARDVSMSVSLIVIVPLSLCPSVKGGDAVMKEGRGLRRRVSRSMVLTVLREGFEGKRADVQGRTATIAYYGN